MSSTPFVNVSPAHPCTICGSTDWCCFVEECGEIVVAGCRREVDPKYAHQSKTDRSGVTINLHFMKGRPSDPVPESYFRFREPTADHERADITTLDAVYRDLLGSLELERVDELELLGRGYTRPEIADIGFRSWPSSPGLRSSVLQGLVSRYATPTLLTVPGFRHEAKKGDEEPEMGMVGGPGYFLPRRDEEGRISGLQLRPRGGKYIMFSSPVGGAGSGLAVHFPESSAPKDGIVGLTEGTHKSEIASRRLGRLVLGLPSIAMVELALPALGALGVKVVELMYDADTREKPTCAAPLRRAAHRLAEAGYEVRIWTWPSAAGKGIDDVLVRPEMSPVADPERDGLRAVTVLRGREVWTGIRDVCRAAKLPADPIQDALLDGRARIAGLLEQVEKDPSIAFRKENIEAIAHLDKGSPEAVALLDDLKVALRGRYTAWSEQLDDLRAIVRTKIQALKAQAAGKQIFKTASHAEIGRALLESLACDAKGQPDVKYARYANGYLHTYCHTEGIWKPIERSRLSAMIQDWDRSLVLQTGREFRADYGPISGAIRCALDRCEEKLFFADAPRGLPFKNGFVRVENNKIALSRHSSEHRALHAYPFEYTEEGQPVRWLRALEELWEGDEDKDEKIAYLQEFVGAALMGDAPRWQRATLLWGPSSQNGKSSLNAAIRSIFLPGMVSSIQPQHFADKFRLAELSGKLANFVDELNGQYLDDSDLIKWIVTAKTPITAERKNQDPFEFLPRAAHFWNCNSLPAADEMGEAFFRRFVVLFFNRRFVGMADRRNYLADIAEQERALIVSWALRGYARLLKNGQYTIPKSSIEHGEQWKQKADQVYRFVDECLVESTDPKAEEGKLINLETAFRLYSTWAKDEGSKSPLKRSSLGERLKALGYEYRTAKLRGYKLKVKPLEVAADPDGDRVSEADLEGQPGPQPPPETSEYDEKIIEDPFDLIYRSAAA
ncbi:phage/plasmid primase, P4 family [Sorangium sp. So ce1389]|uniref:phage/plasmid primase, P4 family n=1 Tax=Sorangium sp. So ce1389 TaxID=3133336 RepID=UPI003F5F82B8